MLSACLVVLGSQTVELPVRVETVEPVHLESFDKGGSANKRTQGGNPRMVEGHLVFDGAQDGNRQVDPQIAVGGGYVLEGTNDGFLIFTKEGKCVSGVGRAVFLDGIDPKMAFDIHNRVFLFDIWQYYDKPKKKPVHIAVSESADPTKGWNIYAISRPEEVDGGGIGYSRDWIGYTNPGGPEQTLVISTKDAKAGKAVKVYHFKEGFGQVVYNQDRSGSLYFLKFTPKQVEIREVRKTGDGTPALVSTVVKEHNLPDQGRAPQAPQKGNDKTSASGGFGPKNVVLQGGFFYCSRIVGVDKRAALQWYKIAMDGTVVATGRLTSPTSYYMQPTVAVNKRSDMLVGFQESSPTMNISARMMFFKAVSPLERASDVFKLQEGQGATEGGPWGDYSGSVVDGDNLTDLWTVQSWANKAGKGPTVIARYRPK